MWLDQYNEYARGGRVGCPGDYLLQSGTDSEDKLANPVYFQDGQTIAVWVASLQDNRLTLRPDGNVVTGSILKRDSFDTRYIRCQPMPFILEESWAEMLVKGAYKERDQVLVKPVREDQRHEGTSDLFPGPVVQVAGFVRKVDFVFFSTQVAPRSDRIRSGT
jgi:hypothetical protein